MTPDVQTRLDAAQQDLAAAKQRLVRVPRGERVNPARRARKQLARLAGVSPKAARKLTKRLARQTAAAITALKASLAEGPEPPAAA